MTRAGKKIGIIKNVFDTELCRNSLAVVVTTLLTLVGDFAPGWRVQLSSSHRASDSDWPGQRDSVEIKPESHGRRPRPTAAAGGGRVTVGVAFRVLP